MEKIIKNGHILIHPLRFRIIELLAANPDGIHISKIGDHIKSDRRLVSWHLLTLEEHGFVKGEYEISRYPNSKGRAIKRYVLTKKAREVLTALGEKLSQHPL